MVILQRRATLCLCLCLLFLGGVVEGGNVRKKAPKPGSFNVMDFGAKGDGLAEDTKESNKCIGLDWDLQAFMAAWQAACSYTGSARLLIPKHTYLLGQVKFSGPCKNVPSLTIYMKASLLHPKQNKKQKEIIICHPSGHLMAVRDLNRFTDSDVWVEFGWVKGLTLTGNGIFDGQGSYAWPFNKCPKNKHCEVLPTSIKFIAMTNTIVKGITSLNSMFFHIGVVDCKNFRASDLHITAPADSPNTDGIHLERCSDVQIHSSIIGTGDDCISVGHGSSQITLSGITCGPGHGISVGSLGRYPNEGDVNGLVVRDSTISGTMNGLRIKTWEDSPGSSSVSNMTFQNIVMKNVGNPIIIDQSYCPFQSCSSSAPSRVKISDISFTNIRGTSSSPVAVTLHCSRGIPCQNVKLHDIHLDYTAGASAAKSTCLNVKATYSGTQIPPPCM
ncbi:exopolygalacturonase-like protein [Cinnamomum micranthum f. kanehirae]|uniref:Exopolygalacturonase-like protein n=1 Tax=Cinnamomum micranthum f. kanehirae TaxID=337451 RepID=A0A443NIE6_9MAGN|nr:exopolygalacturonase-like protein [Cinnamomum micranthum f. kanehirae]